LCVLVVILFGVWVLFVFVVFGFGEDRQRN
jgi:hypothetical protein